MAHPYIVIDDLINDEDAKRYTQLIEDLAKKKGKRSCPPFAKCKVCKGNDFELQTILVLPKTSAKIWEKIEKHLIDADLQIVKRPDGIYKLIGLGDHVTVSRHISPIGIHRDIEGKIKYHGTKFANVKCLYKMAIYLNTNNGKEGGTVLYDDDKKEVITVNPKIGRALIFDIRDFHSGADIPPNRVKYLIGFRLLYHKM